MLSTTSQKVGAVVLVCTVMVAVFTFYAFFAREVTHWMEGEHHWFHDYEPWSLIGFISAFVMATALFLPAQPFVVAVGYLFGFHFLTIFFTYTVYTLSAFLMFNGARFWFRPMVEAWLRDHRVVEGMAQYVKDPREGAKVNLLFSFTPIAFCLHCYAMGITEIKEEVFMITFLLGQSPHIFFGVFTGSALLAAETSDITMDWMKIAMLCAGVGGTFVAVVYLGNVAHDILAQLDDGCSNDRLLAGEKKRVQVLRSGVGLTFEEADDRSIVVSAISMGSPAAQSGVIRIGDVLHEIDGRTMHRADIGLIASLVPGDDGTNVELGLKRGVAPELPSPADLPVYRVVLQRVAAIQTYGALETPPQSPEEKATRHVTWEHPEVVVHGNSSNIDLSGATGAAAEEVTVTSSIADKNK